MEYIMELKWPKPQIHKFLAWIWWTFYQNFPDMGPTWGPSGADRTQVGPMNFAIWYIVINKINMM